MGAIALSLGINGITPPQVYNSLVYLWIQAIGVTPGNLFLSALSTLMDTAVADGWATRVPGFCPLSSEVFIGTNVSVTDTSERLVWHGTQPGQPEGAIHTPLYGITGNGTDFFGDTPAAANTFLDPTNHFLACWMQTAQLFDTNTCGASSVGLRAGFQASNNNQRLDIFPSSGTASVNANSMAGQGLAGYSVTSAGAGFYGGAGVLQTFTGVASDAIPTSKLRVFRFSANAFSTNEISFIMWGHDITQADWQSINGAIEQFHITLGTLRPVPPPVPIGDNCFEVTGPFPTVPWVAYTQANRPADDTVTKDTWANGQATDINGNLVTVNVSSTDTREAFWTKMWVNRRRTANTKDNGIDTAINEPVTGLPCQLAYSDYDPADVASWTKCAYVNGILARNDPRLQTFVGQFRSQGWGFLDIADLIFDTSPWDPYLLDPTSLYTDLPIDTGAVGHNAYFKANATAIFTLDWAGNKSALDRVVLAVNRITVLDGQPIQRGNHLDLEMQDGRSGARLLALLQGIDDIHGAVGLTFAPMGNVKTPTGGTGWTQDVSADILALPNLAFTNIVGQTTQTAPTVDVMVASLQAQYDLFKGPLGNLPVNGLKLLVNFIPGRNGAETPVSYAAACRSFALANGFAGRYVSAGGTPGGALTRPRNQAIATLDGLPTS